MVLVTNAPTDYEMINADQKRIEDLTAQGHSYHCSCRIVWGDGECECSLEKTNSKELWKTVQPWVVEDNQR